MSVSASLVTYLPLVGTPDYAQYLQISDGSGSVRISLEQLLELIAGLDAAGLFADEADQVLEPEVQEDASELDYMPQHLDEPDEIDTRSYVESGEIGTYTSRGIDLTGEPIPNGERPRVRASRVTASR